MSRNDSLIDDPLVQELKRDAVDRRRGHEPDWAAMAQAIRTECDDIEQARHASWLRRVIAWPPFRYSLVGAVAIALAFIGIEQLRGNNAMSATLMPPPTSVAKPNKQRPDAVEQTMAALPRLADVPNLDSQELDNLSVQLRDTFNEEGAEWLGDLSDAGWFDGDGEPDFASADLAVPVNELLPEPNYEQFVDDLDDAQLDAIGAYLLTVKAG